MDTITTIYRCPTARRGARIEARIYDGAKSSLTVPYRHELSAAQNHAEAARAMAEHWDTPHQFAGGATLDGGIWVWVPLVEGVTPLVGVTMPAGVTVSRVSRAWAPA